jgi:hypothetical protein
MTIMTNMGHWQCPFNHINIDEWEGFVYRIIDKVTGKEYIGKKQFWSVNRIKVKGRSNKKVVRKESDWKSYTGSSLKLNDAIKEYGKDKFIFLIESLHETKSSLHYGEILVQIHEDVLRAKLPNGQRKYYNGMINSVKYTPPELTDREKAHGPNHDSDRTN